MRADLVDGARAVLGNDGAVGPNRCAVPLALVSQNRTWPQEAAFDHRAKRNTWLGLFGRRNLNRIIFQHPRVLKAL